MSAGQMGGSDVDIDLRRLAISVREKWKTILGVALIASAAAVLFTSLATPLYRAETRILIETRESAYTRTSGQGEGDRPILDQEGVTSQVEVVSSSDILRRVAEDLQLADRDEFQGGGMRAALGLGGSPDELLRAQQTIDIMREKLSVYQIEGSRVIVVSFSSEDRDLAAAVPNAIADAYIDEQRAAKLLSNEDATGWLAPEIADLRERVREAEGNVAAFRARSGLIVGQNNSTLASQQLSELSSELSRVRASRSASEARAEGIRQALDTNASLEAIPEVLASGAVQRLREREAQLNSEIAELSTTLLDNHPRLRALRSQLADLSNRIRAEARTVLAGLENEARAAQRREASLTADLDALKAASAQTGSQEVELRALEREAAAQRELLESYLTRYREASARGDRNYLPVDARIFARAAPPVSSYYPKMVPIVGATFFGSMLLMVVGILLSELFSGRAMRPASGIMRVPPVPHLVMPAAAALADGDTGDEGEPILQVSVEQAAERLIEAAATRAVFLSPEGEEASAASVQVARELADAGMRVLYLDLTSSGTPSGLMLESKSYIGITNLLSAQAQFTETIHGDLYSDCHVIPSGTAEPRLAMRAADRLPIILTSLNTAYDVVVIECGPAPADALKRVVADATEVLIGVIDTSERRVGQLAAKLFETGYGEVLRVVAQHPAAQQSKRTVA